MSACWISGTRLITSRRCAIRSKCWCATSSTASWSTRICKGSRFIDVGTGPGLPGIPLAIVRPDAHFTLLDSLGKRVRFLRQVQHELGLNNIEPVQSRVEEFPAEPPFDGVISRAFASLQDMLSWCHHLPAKGQGRFYALKGVRPDEELAQLPAGVSLESIVRLQVPELEGERHLVILKAN